MKEKALLWCQVVWRSEKAMAPHSSTLAWKIHGWRSLVGCSPWGRWESDTTERLHFYFSLSFIGEGNGNPLQCSCLENPGDRGAWWAALYGVTQSWTRLKRLSISSSSMKVFQPQGFVHGTNNRLVWLDEEHLRHHTCFFFSYVIFVHLYPFSISFSDPWGICLAKLQIITDARK